MDFVKIYTQGIQSQDIILGSNFSSMIKELKTYCKLYGLSLHFVTAREAYNMVKAAEYGYSGNPEKYREFIHKSL